MLNQNITPSLRQSMINEALNYHQNMNSVVFRRESQSVGVYNNPSGKTDPSQNDIIVEGNIRTRISEIAAAITRLNQTLVYSSSGELAPVYGSGGPKGGVRGRSGSVGREPSGPFPPVGRTGPVRPIHPPPVPVPREPFPPVDTEQVPRGVQAPSGSTDEVSLPPMPPPSGRRSDSPRRRPSGSLGPSVRPAIPLIVPQTDESESGDIVRDIYGSDWAEDDNGVEEYKEGTDEPIAAGPVTVHAPSSKPSASHKTRMLIDNSLATILAGYNSLIDFIELQSKQRLLSTKDSQIIAGLLKDLVPQLKTTIISAQRSVSVDQPDSQVDYSRIYNVVSEIISRITGSPPFLKVDPQLLSESLPIRRDIINAPNFDPKKKVNHIYFENLLDRLKDEELKLFQFHPKSELEKQAREDKLASIRADYTTLTQAGYKPSEKQLSEIESRTTREYEETAATLQQITEAEADARELTESFKEATVEYSKRVADIKKQIATSDNILKLAKAANAKNLPSVESKYYKDTKKLFSQLAEYEDGYKDITEEYKVYMEVLQPYGKFTRKQAEQAFIKAQQEYKGYYGAYSGSVDPASATRTQQAILFHKPNIAKEQAKEAVRAEKYSKLKKAPQSIFGRGGGALSPSGGGPKAGGHVHKTSDPFGDNNELEPYLTKYLRPSKHRRNVQPIESSSDESSGSEEGEAHTVNKPIGGGPKVLKSPKGGAKRGGARSKEKEDWEIIISQPKVEAAVLIEKKKRGRGRPSKASLAESQAIKPAHTTAKSQDLWFLG